MLRVDRRCFLIIGIILTACSRAPRSTQRELEPEETVRSLYDRYLAETVEMPSLADMAPWSDDLRAQLVAMDARATDSGTPILTFDPFIDAQDWHIATVAVETESMVRGSHATVRVQFTNLGRARQIVYDLVWEGGAWRVNNMRGETWDLRAIAASRASAEQAQ